MPDLKEKNRIILKNSKMHELWDLGAPTILEQALQTIVAYVDTAMVGQIGAIASAAVGLTTTVNWLLNGILFSVKRCSQKERLFWGIFKPIVAK